MREDTSVPPLAPLYCGPYLVLEQQNKFFRLQLGDRTDVVSVDRLKPAFTDELISPALPPLLCAGPYLWFRFLVILYPRHLLWLKLLGARKLLAFTFLLRFLLNGILTMLRVREGSALPFLLGGVLRRIYNDLS